MERRKGRHKRGKREEEIEREMIGGREWEIGGRRWMIGIERRMSGVRGVI